jgi:multidrug efflux system membrane fusion protein
MQATLPLFLEGIGHVKASKAAEIKAQVEGRLHQIHYMQGQQVKEGDLLVTIDPRPYEAKLQEAQGALLESQANLRFAEEKVVRFSKLINEDYVSKINFDEYVSNAEALLAQIKKNEGLVKEAQVNLDYCYIKAPFTGRVGKKLIDEGNLIGNDGVTLVTLQQIEPVYVDFSLPEKDLMRVFHYDPIDQLVVKVHLGQSQDKECQGKLLVVDNKVDPSTGMIPIRAEFSNQEHNLWPGQFVKLRVILEQKPQALLVPDEAINLSQKGFYVFVVDKEKKAHISTVTLGEKIGGLVEVLTGVEPGQKVVTNGQFNLAEDDEVEEISCDTTFLKQLNIW